MGVREVILESRAGRMVMLGGAVATLAATMVAVSPPQAAHAECRGAPKPVAQSQIYKCGLSQWAFSYKSNKKVGNKRCYYFLATAWNPCATPSQYNTQACKTI
jgi:hypothetical protein